MRRIPLTGWIIYDKSAKARPNRALGNLSFSAQIHTPDDDAESTSPGANTPNNDTEHRSPGDTAPRIQDSSAQIHTPGDDNESSLLPGVGKHRARAHMAKYKHPMATLKLSCCSARVRPESRTPLYLFRHGRIRGPGNQGQVHTSDAGAGDSLFLVAYSPRIQGNESKLADESSTDTFPPARQNKTPGGDCIPPDRKGIYAIDINPNMPILKGDS